MGTLYKVLDWINVIFIGLTSITMSVQVIYMILSLFVKKVTFKEAEVKHKACVLIPARNEESVVTALIKNLEEQDYPRDRYDIVVIAHNCTDNTAKVAREAGALVYECQSEKRTKGMALKLAIDNYLKDDYEFFIVVDADCRVEKNYITKMNDAFDAGCHVARSYLGNINTFDNAVSQVSALYNVRECRMNARVRERLHMNSQLIGNSFFMSRQVLEEFGGFPSTDSLTEDSDFMVKAMLKNYTIHYVEDAIAYTEVTNTMKELFKRNMRIGKGVNGDLWHNGYKLVGKFFTTGKFTYIDILLTLAFLPVSLISVVWFPLYYGFLMISILVTGNPVQHMFRELNLYTLCFMALGMLLSMCVAFAFQAIFTLILQKDRLLNGHKAGEYKKGVTFFAPVMMMINLAISLGILNPKQKWDSIKRTTGEEVVDNGNNSTNTSDASDDTIESAKHIDIESDDTSPDVEVASLDDASPHEDEKLE